MNLVLCRYNCDYAVTVSTIQVGFALKFAILLYYYTFLTLFWYVYDCDT